MAPLRRGHRRLRAVAVRVRVGGRCDVGLNDDNGPRHRRGPSTAGGDCSRSTRTCSGSGCAYGVVVESVNVSVFVYAPVLSASLALTCCWNATVTASLLIGAA